jgi:lipopolysaccharide assembly outer membrane protein LptD (OstA)
LGVLFIYAAINKDKGIGVFEKNLQRFFILAILFIIGGYSTYAQEPSQGRYDTLTTTRSAVDSLITDSLNQASPDTLQPPPASSSVIQSEIDYSASDSIDNDVVNRRVLLYGNAEINYQDITLKAERIIYNFDSYTVHAEGVQDTNGVWIGLPEFKQGDSQFQANAMDYNFRSKKAFVKQVQTEVVDGVLTGRTVKTTDDNNVIYVRKAEYCPCDDPNAKTRFKIGRLKLIKDEKIVSGPGYLALGKVPLPLAFPFGFFPSSDKKQAGLIIPSYGNANEQGFFLADGGLYLPISDYVDTKILGSVYSRGSWGLSNITRYQKRYRYQGNFGLEYNNFVQGDRELQNFSRQTTFFVNLNHTQDAKANPLSTFSAVIAAGSTNNFTNNINASQNDFLTNTFRSNIRYGRRFYDSPWSISLNAGHEQNSRTGIYSFTLPDVTVQAARTMIFDGLFNDDPKQAFYEKIGLAYTARIQNRLTVHDSLLSLNNMDELLSRFENGINHNAALTTSFKVGAFSVNPSFNYTERWYLRTFGRTYNEETQEFEVDTIRGFDRNSNWSFNTSMTTKLYGMYTFNSGRIKAIRHTLTPSLSYNYTPDFDPNIYGFYGSGGNAGSYSPYDGTLFGGPPRGESQSVRLSLVNNVEAKVLSRRDTTSKFKKVALIENITGSAAYNFAADSLNLSTISINGRTRISQYADLNLQSTFDPYSYVATENGVRRVDVFLVERTGRLASFERASFAINGRGIGSSMFSKNKKPSSPIEEEGEESEVLGAVVREEKPFWHDLEIPWNLNFGYTLNASKRRESIMLAEGFEVRDSLEITQAITFNGDITFFKKVRITFNSGYDFVLKELSTTTITATVDLNCWEFSARVVPFGFRRSYNLALNLKPQMFRDLKLERNRNIGNNENFFL